MSDPERLVDDVCRCDRHLAEARREDSLRSLVGSCPDLTGGVESAEWVRRQREVTPSPARLPGDSSG